MALWPFMLIRKGVKAHPALVRHERIHFLQQLELGIVPFYLWYGLEYLWLRRVRRLPHRDAYLALRFEREAYTHDADIHYLGKRRGWAFRHYGFRQKRKHGRF